MMQEKFLQTKIVVQNAEDGEKFTTLDEIERTLTKDYVCIKDTDKTIGLAGIMGGLDSEIKRRYYRSYI